MQMGSPPHMRGKDVATTRSQLATGITPAHAGKSFICRCCIACSWDHPRTCGEKDFGIPAGRPGPGSPPHMRGKGLFVRRRSFSPGITPAHAGKSALNIGQGMKSRDHPRTCGEKSIIRLDSIGALGSPPHMRGKGNI